MDIGYTFFITGVLLSVAHKEAKSYDTKTVEAHTILNFVDIDEEGNMKPLKIKCFVPHTFKKGDKVTAELAMTSMDSSIFYRALSVRKA